MRLAATLVTALAMTACASWDKSETVVTEIGRLPVEEAIGLSRADIEKRLGLAPVTEPFVSSAALENGVLLERVTLFDMSYPQRCPNGQMPTLGFTHAGQTWGLPSLIYRDGILSEFGSERRMGDDPTQPAFLTATCRTVKRSGRETANDAFEIAIAAPVLLPVAGLIGGINAVGSIGAHDINTSLAQLSLGAAPPGGLEAYIAKLPTGASLVSRNVDTATINFHHRTGNTSNRPAATVTFTDGRVSRVEGSRCTLTPGRAYRCIKT